MVDTQKRIFRASDGRHGSVVFSEGIPAHVFDQEELLGRLNSSTRTPLHTEPFSLTPDGHPELVVVYSSLTSHFVIATQTCDVSGKDRNSLPMAIILPVITVMEICRYQRLPFRSADGETTIEEFLETNAQNTSLRLERDSFRYPEVIRKALADWVPTTSKLQEDRNRIRNYLARMQERGWMYFLKQDAAFQIPEGYVDFSVAFTVPTQRLNELNNSRLARIADPYRDQFAQALANRLSRIAVPTPFKPEAY